MSEQSEHRAASELAQRSPCLLCGKVGTCVPAHFPHHRRRRTWPAVWDRRNWLPLCDECHSFIDGRTGGQMDDDCTRRDEARSFVAEAARAWWGA
jgi:hypothetical protein